MKEEKFKRVPDLNPPESLKIISRRIVEEDGRVVVYYLLDFSKELGRGAARWIRAGAL